MKACYCFLPWPSSVAVVAAAWAASGLPASKAIGPANPVLCACIQSVADGTLSNADQRRVATFFADPEEAQEIRASDTAFADAFWDRYLVFISDPVGLRLSNPDRSGSTDGLFVADAIRQVQRTSSPLSK